MSLINQFIEAMRAAGCGPARADEIKGDDVRRGYQIEGDKIGTKAGTYQVKDMGDFAVGWFRNHKETRTHKWHSKTDKRLTPEERQKIQSQIDEDRARRDEERRIEVDKVAAEAVTLWKSCDLAPLTHPYIERKGIMPMIARLDGGDLLIPMYADNKMWGYQRITADGDKLFLGGARKKGCFCPLADPDEDKSTILVCEGYATGASLRMATGLPTVIGFDSGNLEEVAKWAREKYKDSRIIIAADNDQWTWRAKEKAEHAKGLETREIPGNDPRWAEWRAAGFLWNPGREKAEQAGIKIGAHVIWPDFDPQDKTKRTDFNDLHAAKSLEAVNERIQLANLAKPVEAAGVDHCESSSYDVQHPGGDIYEHQEPIFGRTWEEQAIWRCDSKGEHKGLDADKSFNYGLLIGHFAQHCISWDEFQLKVMVVAAPPWMEPEDRAKFEVHELDDSDLTLCDYWLQKRGLNGSLDKTTRALMEVAMKNPRHPAREYFEGLIWDKTRRLDSWLTYYCGAEDDDRDYLSAVGSKWMIAAVKRVFEPACQWDHMLLLEGRQGSYKSTVFRELSTFGDLGYEKEYFLDSFSLKDCKSKDELLKLWGCLIVEVAEMSGYQDSDIELIKNFITIRRDKFRIPYSRLPKTFDRQFIFGGTRNPVGGFFKDPTGSRRFWPVTVGRIDIQALRKDKGQLWAEAVHRYRAGETLKLTEEMYRKCEAAAQARRLQDDWTNDVMSIVGDRKFIEIREILTALGIPRDKWTRRENSRVSAILRAEGYEYKRDNCAGKQIWGWAPISRHYDNDDEEELSLVN